MISRTYAYRHQRLILRGFTSGSSTLNTKTTSTGAIVEWNGFVIINTKLRYEISKLNFVLFNRLPKKEEVLLS